MRKYTKLLTMLLALVLMLQVAPLAALAETVDSGTYQDENQETTTDIGDETEAPAEPETEAPAEPETEAPTEPETEPETEPAIPLSVEDIQWRVNGLTNGFVTIGEGDVIPSNEALLRVVLSEKIPELSIKIDGKEMTYSKMTNYAFVTAEMTNGVHKMEVIANNGTETASKTVTFRVSTGKAYPAFNLEAPTDLLRGETGEILLNGSNLQNLDSVSLTVEMDRSFKVEDVVLPDGVVGMYMWYRGELQIVADVVDPSLVTDGCLAIIRVKTPVDVAAENFTWNVTSSEAVLNDDSGLGSSSNFAGGFQMDAPEMGITYAYIVETEPTTVKGMAHTVLVKHYNGSAVAGVSVYAIVNGVNHLVGVTDADGKLVTTFFDTENSYTIYAESDDGVLSETVEIACFTPVGTADGVPYGITLNAPVYNGKSISWMSHLLGSTDKAVIRVSNVPSMSNAFEVVGTSTVTYYNDGTNVNRVNTVSVTDLAPGYTYYYQVGDGSVWSEVYSFTVRTAGESVSFAVLGDVVGAVHGNKVMSAIMNGGTAYDFAVQTGNALTDPSDYAAWADMFAQMNGLDLDLIRALSSNESGSDLVQNVYALENEDCYAYEIGNVYIAVINVVDEAGLEDDLYWMYSSAKQSACSWKFMVIHYPVYSTDSAAVNEAVSQLVPNYAEGAGIDVVFSGATGSYGRTNPLTDGILNEKNGVTYVNVGSLGAKAAEYAAGSEFAFATGEFNAIYLGITTTADELTITVYDVAEDGSVSVIDTFGKTPYVCPEGEHSYRRSVAGYVICDVCDHRVATSEYVGPFWIGEDLYFYDHGVMKRGWINHNGSDYFFDTKSMAAVDGEVTIEGYTYVFENYKLKIGAWFERNGITMMKWAGVTQRHTWFEMDGETYYFDQSGAVTTGVVELPIKQADETVVYEYHRFNELGQHQGRLEDGLYVDENLIIYTVNGVAKHAGLVMDDEGNFYYISSSGMGVRDVTRNIAANFTNGLLPEGTYTFGADGKMIDPPAADE